jgi:hypothetical protein
MLPAPISPERLEEHFRAGRVLLDGEPVESLDVLAPLRDSDCARTSSSTATAATACHVILRLSGDLEAVAGV